MTTRFIWLPRVGVQGNDDFLPWPEVTSPAPGTSVQAVAVEEDLDNGSVLLQIETEDSSFFARLVADFPDLVPSEVRELASKPSEAARARLRKVVDDARTRFNTDHAGEPGVVSRPELVEFDSG